MNPSYAVSHSESSGVHLTLVLEELRRLLVRFRLESSELAATGAALLDAAEGDKAKEDDDEAGNGCNDGNFRSLGECIPTVRDAVWLLNLLKGLGFFAFFGTIENCK